MSRALSPRTRAIVVNTPNNPTGKVYSPGTLEALARLLEGASEKNGRRVYQISDESYNRIVYGERQFTSPAQSYAATFVVHTYAKSILAPGLRIGYIALPPGMADRASLRRALAATQIASGWTFPTSLLQRVVPALERMSIDLEALQHRRDRMVSELTAIGYRVHVPEGTFYLIPESPIDDAVAFAGMLRKHGILVIPGTGTLRGHFRISLTATEDMVERSFEGFRAAFAEATTGRRG
jgi:aspartate aminotransferase